MSLQVVEKDEKARSPVQQVRHELDLMQPEFKHALPAHIPVERFMRVVMTAIQRNADLLVAERKSLYSSCMSCAQDGLLPDGREAALVIYNTKKPGTNTWEKRVQYLPMIAGIRKKVRNSDEIATWDARVVFQNDDFQVILGDDERIEHKPNIFNPGKPIAVYSIAVLKNGERSREVMTIAEVESIRQRSKAKDAGPWVTDFNEMARKTVLRRHSKALPMSTDLDDLIRRDDALYDFDAAKDEGKAQINKPKTVQGMLDHFAGEPEVEDAQAEDEAPKKKRGRPKKETDDGVHYDPALSKKNLDVLIASLVDMESADELGEYCKEASNIIDRLTPEDQAAMKDAVAARAKELGSPSDTDETAS